ncbi:MAG: hypothetical protein HY301_20885 [Verrucomicrobia bacterium]|nr:hypothetical protein [Verrucomicrobiota bacterium]
MICPICKNPVPFGLEMHLLAAHGANSAGYARETARIKKELTAKSDARPHRGHKKKKTGTKGQKPQLKHPRLSKLS